MKLAALSPQLGALRARLRQSASGKEAIVLQRFFKTGPGESGEGDQFIGVRVPVLRGLLREFCGLAFADACALVPSPLHEEGLLALLIMVDSYERGDESQRAAIFQFYVDHTVPINNWDLVASSAPGIVGRHLERRARKILFATAGASNLWDRRIAVLATFHFIRRNEFFEMLRLAKMLLPDRHDLIHKAVGWMLREVGKRDAARSRDFLEPHPARMPHTMLRSSIEKLPVAERRHWLSTSKGKRL